MRVSCHRETWPLEKPFVINGFIDATLEAVVVELSDGEHLGRGEAAGVDFLGETADVVFEALESAIPLIEKGVDRRTLLDVLPRGGARNAIDCALWDLECKGASRRVWDLAGTPSASVETVYTIGIDTPGDMAREARASRACRILKIKLSGDDPIGRVAAIRDARPDARLVVDANQGWSLDLLDQGMADLVSLGVEMIEQPLPRGGDDGLVDYRSPIPLCADESCLDSSELDHACARYQMINIKLDKAGGLTEALALAQAARARGMRLMVGNMIGTSLAMAPAFVVAQYCDFVDIDGPLLLRRDRIGGLSYEGGRVGPPAAALWG